MLSHQLRVARWGLLRWPRPGAQSRGPPGPDRLEPGRDDSGVSRSPYCLQGLFLSALGPWGSFGESQGPVGFSVGSPPPPRAQHCSYPLGPGRLAAVGPGSSGRTRPWLAWSRRVRSRSDRARPGHGRAPSGRHANAPKRGGVAMMRRGRALWSARVFKEQNRSWGFSCCVRWRIENVDRA